MTEWYGPDGEPLGRWEVCSADEYVHVLDHVLGEDRTVFASRTEVGESLGDGRYSGRIMHTEWGRKGDGAPMVRCHDTWDFWGERDHVDYRFVLAAGVGVAPQTEKRVE